VVRNALELREGNAFERGRFVGRWEKETEWQARDAARKTSKYTNLVASNCYAESSSSLNISLL
jgi:hypothetical protein